jgi:hypothetical protein
MTDYLLLPVHAVVGLTFFTEGQPLFKPMPLYTVVCIADDKIDLLKTLRNTM